MGNSEDYIWSKMHAAVGSMCGMGDLNERLSNATVSSLWHLRDDELQGTPLYEHLAYVLAWTKHNIKNDREMKKLPDEIEHKDLIKKMLHILLETHRKK